MEHNCTLLLHYDKAIPPNEDEISDLLTAKDVASKISGLKTLISLQLNGEAMPKQLMTVIRFCVPENDHMIKKLLLVYWEVVEKTGPDGKLLPEMILVCNNLRNDLSHPNEYIRGCTLRFLCKLKEAEILEPLIPTIKNNLEHRHSFVRRNGVLAVFAIFKSFDYLLPDGPELVEKVLQTESDASCKRNAFLMLFQTAQERAVAFLSENLDQVAGWGDILQLVVLELIRKVVRANPFEKSKYIRCILTLFNAQSNAVVYECASALIALTSSPTAIRAAATSYTQLLSAQSDNNIKLIVLERLQELKKQHPKVLQEMIMDIMRALASANLDIRKKTLDICLDLIVPKNSAEVMQVLRKEVQKTQGEEGEKNAEYRGMLISAIHAAAVKFPDAAASVVPTLMDFLGDAHQSSAVDVVLFVREMVETYTHLRESVMQKLLSSFGSIQSSRARLCSGSCCFINWSTFRE
jgi:coatomer subunit beta